MSTAELVGSNQTDQTKGVIGPDPQEIEKLNQLTGPIRKSRFSRFFQSVSAVLGITSAETVLEACAPPQQTETRHVQTPGAEIIKLKPSILITNYGAFVPQELSDLDQQLKPQVENIIKVTAKNPDKTADEVSFYFLKTTGKEYLVVFPVAEKQPVVRSYNVIIAEKDQKAQKGYVTTDNAPFIIVSTNEPFPQKADRPSINKVLDAVENADEIREVELLNPFTGERVSFKKEEGENIFQKVLQALSSQKAYAAELPAEPTPTLAPPKPTATATETATPSPTPTPDVPKPAYEKTFPTGAVEKYDMVTEKNFDKYFARVSWEEFEQLLKEQPDLPLFPFIPLSNEFSIGEFTFSTAEGTTNQINVYSDHLLVVSTSDGEVSLVQNPQTKKYSKLIHDERKSEQIANIYSYSVSGNNSTLTPKIEAPLWSGQNSKGKPVKKDNLLAEFFGADPFETPRGYSASANQIAFSTIRLEKLPEPKVTVTAKSITTETNKVTDVTLLLADPNSWVHTKEGKIAIVVP